METRILKLNPDLLHTVNPEALAWNGKPVTVVSWHSNLAPTTRKLFPNDEWVGFVEELCMDFPESELHQLNQ